MSSDILRRAAEQARAEAATELSIAPAIERMYGGDDSGTRATARRHAAVADWLEKQAEMSASGNGIPVGRGRGYEQALAVARAYLEEAS